MFVFLLILLVVALMNNQVKGSKAFFTDYSSPVQTAAVNGIFVILIFLSHSTHYITSTNKYYAAVQLFLGQLVVAAFLFFSGFGMMESIRKKGIEYVKGIPGKRLFKVWYHFAIAIVFYIILNLFLGRDFGLLKTLLAFTGLTVIESSNWYMFVTFVLYIIVFVSFMVFRKSKLVSAVCVTVLTVVFAVLEYKNGLPNRFYNTIICFPAGMLFSLIKPYFDKFVMKNDFNWVCTFILFLVSFGTAHYYRKSSLLVYGATCVLFVFLIMVFTMKVKICNGILVWFGKHVFSIYILQRIPMAILKHLGVVENIYLFVIISFVATVVFAALFDKCTDKLDEFIYRKKKSELVKR